MRAVFAELSTDDASDSSSPRGQRRFRPMLSRISRVVRITCITAAIVLVVALFALAAAGWRLVPVLSGSMRPTLQPGDAAVMRPLGSNQIAVGDVVVHSAPIAGNPFVIHRVVGLERDNDQVSIRTKGDANAAPDAWTTDVTNGTVYQRVTMIPHAGFLLVELQHFRATGVILFASILLFAILAIKNIWRLPIEIAAKSA